MAALELEATLVDETAAELTAELTAAELTAELIAELTADELATAELATKELVTELAIAEEATLLAATEEAAELTAAPQLVAKLMVVEMIVLVLPLITTLVQPLAATSVAGKASVPQPPLGSILKRGPPPASPTVKLRQISKLVDEPATGVIKSPSAQALWVPRKWKGTAGADEATLEVTLELELDCDFSIRTVTPTEGAPDCATRNKM